MATRKPLIGRKIRRLRNQRGWTQVDLAAQLEISGSYLNLIEHEQRAVTVPLLLKLARLFDIELSEFDADEETRLAADLAEVFKDPLLADEAEVAGDLAELATVSPGAGKALLKLYVAYQGARADARMVAERLSSGDELAGIESARIPSEEVSDFLQRRHNHFADLEQAAEQLWVDAGLESHDMGARLVEHLRAEHGVEVEVVSSDRARGAVRQFQANRKRLVLSEVLAPRSRHFQLAHQIALLGLRDELDAYANHEGGLTSEASRALGRVALANYFAGAVLMPYEPFLTAAQAVRYDIERLGHRFRTSFEQVCHRLTTMQRPGQRGVPFHMIRVDIAGNISKRFTASGIRFARYSGACPKWNVHASFMTPGFIRTQLSTMPDGTTYFCVARTVRKEGGGYQVMPSRFAIGLGCEARFARELIYADGMDVEGLGAAVPVGISCRLCERTDCAQRAFPALQHRLTVDENQRALSFYASAQGPEED